MHHYRFRTLRRTRTLYGFGPAKSSPIIKGTFKRRGIYYKPYPANVQITCFPAPLGIGPPDDRPDSGSGGGNTPPDDWPDSGGGNKTPPDDRPDSGGGNTPPDDRPGGGNNDDDPNNSDRPNGEPGDNDEDTDTTPLSDDIPPRRHAPHRGSGETALLRQASQQIPSLDLDGEHLVQKMRSHGRDSPPVPQLSRLMLAEDSSPSTGGKSEVKPDPPGISPLGAGTVGSRDDSRRLSTISSKTPTTPPTPNRLAEVEEGYDELRKSAGVERTLQIPDDFSASSGVPDEGTPPEGNFAGNKNSVGSCAGPRSSPLVPAAGASVKTQYFSINTPVDAARSEKENRWAAGDVGSRPRSEVLPPPVEQKFGLAEIVAEMRKSIRDPKLSDRRSPSPVLVAAPQLVQAPLLKVVSISRSATPARNRVLDQDTPLPSATSPDQECSHSIGGGHHHLKMDKDNSPPRGRPRRRLSSQPIPPPFADEGFMINRPAAPPASSLPGNAQIAERPARNRCLDPLEDSVPSAPVNSKELTEAGRAACRKSQKNQTLLSAETSHEIGGPAPSPEKFVRSVKQEIGGPALQTHR